MAFVKETIEHSRTWEPTEGFGRTFVARASAPDTAREVLERIAAVWQSVSKWGRWCDDDLGDWPNLDEALASLPKWFQDTLCQEPDFEVTNWLDDLHDREWIWWNGAVMDGFVKIDLCAESMPISAWTIEYVIEKAGGFLVYKGDWMPDVNMAG